MADYISNWAVKLTANASGLVQGLDAGAAKIQGFVTQTTIATKALGSGVASALQSVTGTSISSALAPLGGIGSSLMGFATSLAASNPIGILVGVGAAAAATAGAVASFGVSSINAIDASARLANRIGVTTQEMLGLQNIATSRGLSFDDLKDGMDGYARNLAKLNQELRSGHAGPIVNALGTLGINAAEFVRLPVASQLAQLSQGLGGVSDGMQRMALTEATLGRHGRVLSPILGADPNQLANLGNVASDAGQSITQDQSAGIQAAALAFRQFKQVFSDLVGAVQIAAATTFAPFAGFLSNTLRDAFNALAPAFRMIAGLALGFTFGPVIAGVVLLAGAVQFFMPVLQGIGNGFRQVARAAGVVWDALGPVVSALVTSFGALFGSTPTLNLWGQGFAAVGNLIALSMVGAGRIIAMFISTVASGLSSAVSMAAEASVAISAMQVAAGGTVDNSISIRLANLAVGLRQVSSQANTAANGLANFSVQQLTMQNGPPPLAGVDPAWTQRLQQLRDEGQLIGNNAAATAFLQARRDGLNMVQAEAVMRQVQLNEGIRQEAEFVNQTFDIEEQIIRARAESAFEADLAVARHRGISRELIAQRQEMQEQLEIAQHMNQLRQQGEQLRQQMRDPGEVYTDRIAALREMLQNDAIDQQTFARGVADAANNLFQAGGQQQDRNPQAALLGSVAEQQAIVRAQQQDSQQRLNPQERVAQVMERIRAQGVEQQRLMQELVDAAQRGFIGNRG